MKTFSTKRKAFTLIELLIVIAIIGILFIVLVSKVDFATDKAKASGVQTDFRSFQVALEMVSKENAGFNTFGWDTGDNAGAAPSGYTYTNATKDAGDRIRNSYDEGDTNLNGTYDDGEVWTGRKIYTETWTGCYTLINPGNASDMSAIFDLETAINKNLDPKLHIVIADDGTISMANGYKDPWSTQYHGQYITNASADAAAKWNTDAAMSGSTGDNMDRGAILMYSNGANQKFGTKVKIVGGVVTATVSQIDADHLDNNKMGADDYVLAVVYTYTNGYGETAAITSGFSNNQTVLGHSGNNLGGGAVVTPPTPIDYEIIDGANETFTQNETTLEFRSNADYNKFVEVKIDGSVVDPSNYTVTEGSTIVTFTKTFFDSLGEGEHTVEIISEDGVAEAEFEVAKPTLPAENPSGTVNSYSWSELKLLAQAKMSAADLKSKYGIKVGDYKEVNGVKYILVDIDGNDYDGFVFMYKAGSTNKAMNTSSTNAGGYASTDVMKDYVDGLYAALETSNNELYKAIKKVNIICNDGSTAYNSGTYTHEVNNVGMFLASAKEVGFNVSGWTYADGYNAEGTCFDLFTTDNSSRAGFMSTANISENWWLRSATSGNTSDFGSVYASGSISNLYAANTYAVVPAFVIG